MVKGGGGYDQMLDEDPFGEAGLPCGICSSETRTQTHFGAPCRHSACKECWDRWLGDAQHRTCMICGNGIDSIHRFSERLAPEATAADESPFDAANNDLETALAGLIEALVGIKTIATDVGARLGECEEHLERGSMHRMAPEARMSVASVEASAVEEQVGVLQGLATHEHWGRLGGQVAACRRSAERLGVLLDELHASEYGAGGEGALQQSLESLGATRRLLRGCSCGMVRGQWRPTESLLRSCLEERLPGLVRSLRSYEAVDPGLDGRVQRLRERVEARVVPAGEGLEGLLPELELMLIRVESCFDHRD